MAEETKTQSDIQSLPEGFVIRTREGKLRIVKDGRLVDYFESAVVSPVRPAPISVSRPTPQPPQPQGGATVVPRATPVTQPSVSQGPSPMPQIPVQSQPVRPISPRPSLQTPQIPQRPSSPVIPPIPTQPQTVSLPPELQPQKPFASTSRPAYFIEAEDEEDAAGHREKIAAFQTPRLTEDEIARIIDGVVSRNAVTLEDEVMKKRFYNILRSRLLEIRNMLETEDTLTRPQKVGGMGFESGLVRRLIVDIEDEANKLSERGAIEDFKRKLAESAVKAPPKPYAPHIPLHPLGIPQSVLESASRKVEPVVLPQPRVVISRMEQPKSVEQPGIKPTPPPAVSSRTPHEILKTPIPTPVAPIQPTVVPHAPWLPPVDKPKPEPILQPKPVVSEPEVKIPVTVEPPKQKIVRPLPPLSRPQVSDIVETPQRRTYGPIEELSELSIQDFRRYGTSVEDGKKKILEKVELLEEESYAKRSQGIKAWRRSPLFQLYLSMGRQSIETGKSIEQVIASRAETRQDTLSAEEFSAMADISAVLRQ